MHTAIINYTLKGEVAIVHMSTHYTLLQMKNSARNIFAESSCYRKCRWKHTKARGKPHCTITHQYLKLAALSAKTQRRTKVNPWYKCIVCTAVCEKACLGTKQIQIVKKSNICCWVTFDWGHQLVSQKKIEKFLYSIET